MQLYRFRYTVANLSARTLQFRINNALGSTFATLVAAGADWSGNTTGGAAQVSATGLDIAVIPAPASAALLGLGGLVAARRRRA